MKLPTAARSLKTISPTVHSCMLQVLHESHVPLDCAHFDPDDLQFRTIGTFEQVSSISQPGFLSRTKGLLSHLQYLGVH